MKKPSSRPQLRAKNLDMTSLEKASGGRGTIHGYYQCDCGFSGTSGGGCPECTAVVQDDMYFAYLMQSQWYGY